MHVNYDREINDAIEKLGNAFPKLNWDFSPDPSAGSCEPVSHWLGEADEEVMINVFKGKNISESFHRQDFFFIHFACHRDYEALSAKYNNRITIIEGDCYIGQPYSGYTAKRNSDEECIIIGVLIRRETFIREFLSSLAADAAMLSFFLEPHNNQFSEEFIHLPYRMLLRSGSCWGSRFLNMQTKPKTPRRSSSLWSCRSSCTLPRNTSAGSCRQTPL